MATTIHLGDCMQACNKCMENYHSTINGICPMCYTNLTKENN